MWPSAQATRSASPRVTGSVMLLCVTLSIVVHLGSAFGAGIYFSERSQYVFDSAKRISMPDMPQPVQAPDPPLRLGREDSSTASISWLGVTSDPVLGEGQESTVEQAQLTIVPGDAQQEAQSRPPIQQPTPIIEPNPPSTSVESQTEITEAEPESQSQPETVSEPEFTPEPSLAKSEVSDPIAAPNDPEFAIIEEVPVEDEKDIPEAISMPSETETESQTDPETNPIEEPMNPTVQTVEPSPEVPVMTQPASTPNQTGKPGKADDRESIASIIRRAQEVRAASLNQPLSGEGLEIKPVEPKFPASIRFTQLPRNPIVLIRFNAQGRVVNAKFLHDEEKKRVYDTGSKGVDEPLINAIYKWRASGKQLESLDPDDPESTIEISMRILFRDE